MKKLTAKNVRDVFMDCLYRDGEDTKDAVLVEGVVNKFGLCPARLRSHVTDIRELLQQLPVEFQSGHQKGGGGWSFLNACVDKDGEQWGEHENIEQLLVLGLATHQATILLPRNMWSLLPGGMPYFSVLAPIVTVTEVDKSGAVTGVAVTT
jgi:hypothetical protein